MTSLAARQKILFVSARLPFPALEGHQIRAYGILKQLAKYYDVHLLSILRPGEEISYTDELSEQCVSIKGVKLKLGLAANISAGFSSLYKSLPLVVSRYVTPELKQAFQHSLDTINPDIVHLDLLPLAELFHLVPSGIKTVLDEHNVESDLIAQKLEITSGIMNKIIYRREQKLLAKFEQQACQASDLVLACSDQDNHTLSQFGAIEVHTIPNGVDTTKLKPSKSAFDENHIVFLGGMGWYPNRLGMEWFLKHVLEKIVSSNNKTHLHLIGNPEPYVEVPIHLSQYVTKHGFVDDFTKIVGASGIMIVPLHVGSGTRLKVVEAASMGCCMVSTRKGAEGVQLTNKQSVIFADTDKDFANAVLALQKRPDAINQIGKNARKVAEKIYDWDAIGVKLNIIYSGSKQLDQASA